MSELLPCDHIDKNGHEYEKTWLCPLCKGTGFRARAEVRRDFRQEAKTLITPTMELIEDVLTKYTIAILEVLHEQVKK